MWLLILLSAVLFSTFFYYQATISGLGRKRWAFAGMLFGPFIWPMFQMKKRVKLYRVAGQYSLIWRP